MKKKVEEKNGSTPEKRKRIKVIYMTEEDYEKQNYWSVGPFHRASEFLKKERPGGDGDIS
jgi:hypothetical protein